MVAECALRSVSVHFMLMMMVLVYALYVFI